jgi:hypothetical protein
MLKLLDRKIILSFIFYFWETAWKCYSSVSVLTACGFLCLIFVTAIVIVTFFVPDFLYRHNVTFDNVTTEVEILDTSKCAVSGLITHDTLASSN